MNANLYFQLVKKIALVILIPFLACTTTKNLELQLAEAQAEIALLQAETSLQNLDESQLVHIVFLKLKDDIQEQSRLELLDAIKDLQAIESLNNLVIGEIAQTNDARFISDHELVFYIWVSNMDDYAFYQKHELHLQLKQIAKKYLAKAPAVYDFWTR